MTAGQQVHSQHQVWLGDSVSAGAAFATGVVLTVVLALAIAFSGAFAGTTRAPAPGVAPDYHLNDGSTPRSVPGSIRFTPHAE